MKKQLCFVGVAVFAMGTVFAQDLPDNPEPGKCYVRCKTPEVWKNEDVKVEISPAYKKIVTHPATYKTVTEQIMIKEASKRYEIVPAVWETKTFSYKAKEDASKLKVVPASFSKVTEMIETKAASARWEMSEKAPDCESSDPNDCRYWCYKPVPAQMESVPVTKLIADTSTEKSSVPGYDKSYTRRVIVKPATTREIEVPAVYKTVTRRVIDKDAWQEEVTVEAKHKTVTKEVLINKGGLTTWKEVECELLSYSPLPINWNLNSATLTPKAKQLIDTRLLPILKDGVQVELASHTDSRGSKASNQDLSDRRAKAVVRYLMQKGVNPSQLVGKGYGETKLKNRCADGVSCTEAEHLVNRRTEFRVINQK